MSTTIGRWRAVWIVYTIRITCYTCLPGHVMGQVPWHMTGKVPVWALNHAPSHADFPCDLSRYRAKTHLNTSHDLRMTPFSASPNGVGARRAWLSFGDVGFSGLLVSGSFSGLLVFLAWLWCGCLFFWFFLLGLSFCVFLVLVSLGLVFSVLLVSGWSGSGFREEGAP